MSPRRSRSALRSSSSTASVSPKVATSMPRPARSRRRVRTMSCCSTQTAPRRLAESLARRRVHGHEYRVGSVHREAACPVHHVDVATGVGPQVALHRVAHDGRCPTALRAWIHHVHAYRQHEPVGAGSERSAYRDPRAVRPGVPPGRSADLPQQGQERAGGARSDPSRRRSDPHARRGERRARRRRAPVVRTDLDSHRRVSDGRRAWSQADDSPRCHVDARRARDVSRRGQGVRLPRLAARVRRRHRRGRRGRVGSGPARGRRGRGGELHASSRRSATRPSRRRATPKRASSRSSKSAASVVRPRTRPSSKPSRPARTCGARAPRSFPRGPRSR